MNCLLRTLGLALVLAFAFPAAGHGQEPYSFYGLQFGMDRGQVETVMPMVPKSGKVRDPGHGMASLALAFDRTGALMEINASYAIPEDNLEQEGLKRALREKIITPLRNLHPGIQANMDEYRNRSTYTIHLLSRKVLEENIEFHKAIFLKALE